MHVKVYPNPSKEDFSFEVSTDVDQYIAKSILDMTGELVLQVENVMPHQIVKLGANLANGMFMARVRQGENL